MEKLYKKTKKEYTARYRKEHADKVSKYNKEHQDENTSRVKARRKVVAKVGKAKVRGKEIHHADGNPKNNNPKNLKVVKKGHSGGKVGNKNAKGKHKK